METRMDVRHFFEVVRMWKPMALRNLKGNKNKKTKTKTKTKKKEDGQGKKYAQREWKKENRQCLQNS